MCVDSTRHERRRSKETKAEPSALHLDKLKMKKVKEVTNCHFFPSIIRENDMHIAKLLILSNTCCINLQYSEKFI